MHSQECLLVAVSVYMLVELKGLNHFLRWMYYARCINFSILVLIFVLLILRSYC